MSDFDMDAFDSIDFDSVEQSVAEKQAEKDKQESQEIEGMRDGANDCGDICTIYAHSAARALNFQCLPSLPSYPARVYPTLYFSPHRR